MFEKKLKDAFNFNQTCCDIQIYQKRTTMKTKKFMQPCKNCNPSITNVNGDLKPLVYGKI